MRVYMRRVEKKKAEKKKEWENRKWEWGRHGLGLWKFLDWKGQFGAWGCPSYWIGSIEWPIWLHKTGH